MHMRQAQQAYIDDLASRGYTALTIALYARTIVQLTAMIGDIDVHEVTIHQLLQFLRVDSSGHSTDRHDSDNRPHAMSSSTQYISSKIFSRFFQWLNNSGHLSINPAINIPFIARTPRNTYAMTSRTADKLCSIIQPPHSRMSALTWRTITIFLRYVACSVTNAGKITALDFNDLDGCPVFRIPKGSSVPWIAMCRGFFPLHRAIIPVIHELCRERPMGPLFPDLGTTNVTNKLHEGLSRRIRHGCLIKQEYLPLARKIAPKFMLRSWQDYLFSFIYTAYAADHPLPRIRTVRHHDPLPFHTLRTVVESMP
jgi:hypothetical protein